MLTILRHVITHFLHHNGDCKLLGIAEEGSIFVEELYGEDDWLAQHRLTLDQGIVDTVDENHGKNLHIHPLSLPDTLEQPISKIARKWLNYTGARLRGIREEERIEEIVLPLSIEDKIELVDYMEWDIEPMQLIGIAESTVLASAYLPDETLVVCRRVRVVYHLRKATPTYDYDALEIYLLHDVLPDDDIADIVDCLNDDDNLDVLRPMDCMYYDGYLYVADGGEDDDLSAIHIFEYQVDSKNS